MVQPVLVSMTRARSPWVSAERKTGPGMRRCPGRAYAGPKPPPPGGVADEYGYTRLFGKVHHFPLGPRPPHSSSHYDQRSLVPRHSWDRRGDDSDITRGPVPGSVGVLKLLSGQYLGSQGPSTYPGHNRYQPSSACCSITLNKRSYLAHFNMLTDRRQGCFGVEAVFSSHSGDSPIASPRTPVIT